MQTLVYAHRGSSKAYAENTRAAYMQALADGADGIECDIHLSADGFVVCHHDPTVDRTSNSSGRVGEKTLAQLKSLDFSSWRNPHIPSQFGILHDQLITLRELVELMLESGREIGLAVEIKHPSPFGRKLEEAMLAELKHLGWEPQESRIKNIYVSFMSFDPESVRYLLERIPGRHVCQLVTEVDEEWIDELVLAGESDRAAVASVLAQSMAGGVELLNSGIPHLAGPGIEYIRKHPQTINTWLQNGSTFRVWTVDDPKDAKFLVGLGVTQLTSNVPALIKAKLGLS
ncbi:glycerophosphodiester phosphodiesterase [Arthrobacter sp. MYb227]|uniref:glycerophosphodiester phosphodiesterase n=1 Tax=Arthrobacter sp. MYb227 TaxID=1848601 RepID=UPI000CFB5BE8|nr:glycerophosphodiester phosphodiesterase family protein [Arthrobacter sp. MYb227]PQZ89038.1 glycerophosphodiester phosphodiesterase [Arthrobacter sp. MYb227]